MTTTDAKSTRPRQAPDSGTHFSDNDTTLSFLTTDEPSLRNDVFSCWQAFTMTHRSVSNLPDVKLCNGHTRKISLPQAQIPSPSEAAPPLQVRCAVECRLPTPNIAKNPVIWKPSAAKVTHLSISRSPTPRSCLSFKL